MIHGEEKTRSLLTDYLRENRKVFFELRGKGKAQISRISKEFPLGLHGKVRDEIIDWIGVNGFDFSFRFAFTVDPNIIISDAFRVAKDRRSATLKIFCCPNVDLVAHSNLRNEVMRAIEKDLPKGADKQKALNHANYLLSLVKTISDPMASSLKTAVEAVGNIDPADVPFLAVRLSSNSKPRVRGDTEEQEERQIVKRWDIRDYANVVSVAEEGALSLFILSLTGMSAIKQVEYLITLFYDALSEVFLSLKKFLSDISTSVAEAYEKLPLYLKRLLALAGVVSIIARALKNKVPNPLEFTLRKAMVYLADFLKEIKIKLLDLFHGIRELIVLLWNQIIPAGATVVVIAGVLWDTVLELVEDCQELVDVNLESIP
jgi:predicted nucleic acid-binding protein